MNMGANTIRECISGVVVAATVGAIERLPGLLPLDTEHETAALVFSVLSSLIAVLILGHAGRPRLHEPETRPSALAPLALLIAGLAIWPALFLIIDAYWTELPAPLGTIVFTWGLPICYGLIFGFCAASGALFFRYLNVPSGDSESQ